MTEHDALVLSYTHLKRFPREQQALASLKKIASLVKPIMRARGWKVGELGEFYPAETNLLGLNINRGRKILVRLRYPNDRSLFLPIEEVTDTMLHELSHIVHGPHDGKFHALWNQLRDEHEALIRKGYTGEGFLSDGHRLGGGPQLPMHEARRLAREAAEKRKVLTAGSGQRLGGAAPRPGQDIRKVIISAVERRQRTLEGCGNTNHNEKEIDELSESASRNGFKTQAEEDKANEAAIAQALWELVQEDEKAKYGRSYVPPSAENPEGSSGGAVLTPQRSSGGVGKPLRPEPNRPSSKTPPPVPLATKPSNETVSANLGNGWACTICTLVNPSDFLCCDACGTQRSERQTKQVDQKAAKRTRAVVDLTSSPPPKPEKRVATGIPAVAPDPPKTTTWQCSLCGNNMERMWWTCSTCGKLKDDSK